MKCIYILGVNGNARDIVDTIHLIRKKNKRFPPIGGFLDDKLPSGTMVDGIRVYGSIKSANRLHGAYFINAIGSPKSYQNKPFVIERITNPTSSFISVIHPLAQISPSASIGQGCTILSHTSIGTGVKIGSHVMVLQNCVISHDSIIEDYAVMATGVCLSGKVHVRKGAYLGSKCCIRGGLIIGEESLIGMGSIVLHNIPDQEVWCGNPARYLRKIL